MSYSFRPYHQDQLLLMPPSLQEWVKEDSLVRFISDVVDSLAQRGRLEAIYARYREDGWGAPAYHPAMMVKVLLHAYTNGITSARRMEMLLETDVGFRFLAANQRPDHRTISGFRNQHMAALCGLFTDVLELCMEAGLVKLGRVALDGRRVQGNASPMRNRMRAQLQEEMQALLEEAARVDAAEDRQHGPDARGDELPSGLKDPKKRAERLQRALAELEAKEEKLRQEQAERIETRQEEERRTGRKKGGRKLKEPEKIKLREDARANPTDPESRIIRTRRGWIQGYNAQAMADCGSQVIVAQQVTNQECDAEQVAPMLARCEAQAGARPKQVLADAGYWSEANGALDGEGGTDLLIATVHRTREHPDEHPQRDRMDAKLASDEGKAAFGERCTTIEPVFGQMEMRGLQRFLLRGKAKVGLEWSLWCTTHNLLKLWRATMRARAATPGARLALIGA
jgi:transposase